MRFTSLVFLRGPITVLLKGCFEIHFKDDFIHGFLAVVKHYKIDFVI